jgi:hypothetical protein
MVRNSAASGTWSNASIHASPRFFCPLGVENHDGRYRADDRVDERGRVALGFDDGAHEQDEVLLAVTVERFLLTWCARLRRRAGPRGRRAAGLALWRRLYLGRSNRIREQNGARQPHSGPPVTVASRLGREPVLARERMGGLGPVMAAALGMKRT